MILGDDLKKPAYEILALYFDVADSSSTYVELISFYILQIHSN